jgi:hypothetical protein
MSRHTIPAREEQYSIVVGYDRGMSSFFGIVTDIEIERKADEAAERVTQAEINKETPAAEDLRLCDAEAVAYWIGAACVGEIRTVEDLAERMKAYAEIAPEMLETLRRDHEQAGEPSEAQRIGQRFIESQTNR